MKYNDIKKELNSIEVNDLDSAIKFKLLDELSSILSETNRKKTHKIEFIYDDDLNSAVDEIKYKFELLFNEYMDQCIELKKLKNKEIMR